MATITSNTIKFLKGLKKNNSKEWFDANRKSYDLAKTEYLAFVAEVLEKLKLIDPSLAELQPKQCVFRINRDVRFSANKDPYKTNMGASFSKGGKKINCAGYYFHLEPGECFIGGGYWMPEAQELAKIRQEIDYSFDEFSSIISSKQFKKIYPELNKESKLVRPPKGYDADNHAIEYLKLKNFVVLAPIGDEEVMDKNLVKKVITYFETQKPLIDFLNRAIDA